MTRNLWRVLFLGVAALWTGMEVYAANDHDPNTEPLTSLVVDHVPALAALCAGAAGLAWLVEHFWTRYARKRKERQLRQAYLSARESMDPVLYARGLGKAAPPPPPEPDQPVRTE